MVRTGATFADAAAEYRRSVTENRGRKHSTIEDYPSIIRVHLLPAFGEMALEQISVGAVEEFQTRLGHREHNGRRISPRTRNKVLIVLQADERDDWTDDDDLVTAAKPRPASPMPSAPTRSLPRLILCRMPPPEIGRPLPRPADAYAACAKWDLWILARRPPWPSRR